MAAAAVLLAALVATYVMHRSCESSDEVANTYQAAAFAKLRAYGQALCPPALTGYWVVDWEGRPFSQYTPGWPLFMAPFVRAGLTWMAGPCSLGLMVAVTDRLGRRAAAEGLPGASPRQITAAGLVAGLGITLGSTMLINGGSRFPHLYSAFLFGTCVEALCVLTRPTGRAQQWGWGAALGASAATLLGTRPAEGAFLGLGLAAYALYSVARRRAPWRGAVAAALTLGLFGGLYLVILRLQAGTWFATGYGLVWQLQPGFMLTLSAPKALELKFASNLATGSYCWWPCSPALGLAGMLTARRPGWRVPFLLGSGGLALLAFLSTISYGRYSDWGYGPRYVLPLVVPMAVGGALLLAPFLAPDERAGGAPAARAASALILFAALAGVLRIAPLVYPYNYNIIGRANQVFQAIKLQNVHHAVVVVARGTAAVEPRFYVQNLPVELYPEQDVVVIHERDPRAVACVRDLLPDRTFYRTVGAPEVTLKPFPPPAPPEPEPPFESAPPFDLLAPFTFAAPVDPPESPAPLAPAPARAAAPAPSSPAAPAPAGTAAPTPPGPSAPPP